MGNCNEYFRSSALPGHWRMERHKQELKGLEGEYTRVYYLMHETMTRQKMNRVLKTANWYAGQAKELRCISRYDWGYHYTHGKAGVKILNKIHKISDSPDVD